MTPTSDTKRITEVDPTHPLPSQPTQHRWSPARLFADHAFAARMWALVAIGALVLAILQPYLLIKATHGRERVVVLDEAGTFSISPLLGFEESKTLHETMAMWATLALLQRNPRTFDFPELLQKIYLTDACGKANKDMLASRDEFEAKQLHQKVEVFKIDILRTREDQVIVKVTGQLVRSGVFERQPFIEAPQFALTLTLIRNPNMLVNKRYPLAVWTYDYAQQ